MTWRHPPLVAGDPVLGAKTRETIEDIRRAVVERIHIASPGRPNPPPRVFGERTTGAFTQFGRTAEPIAVGEALRFTIQLRDMFPWAEFVAVGATPLSLASDVSAPEGTTPAQDPSRPGNFVSPFFGRGFFPGRDPVRGFSSGGPVGRTQAIEGLAAVADIFTTRGVPDPEDGRTLRHVTGTVHPAFHAGERHNPRDPADFDTRRIPADCIAWGVRERGERFVRWTGTTWVPAPDAQAPTKFLHDPDWDGPRGGHGGYYGLTLRTVLDRGAVARAREAIAGIQWFAIPFDTTGIPNVFFESASGGSGPEQDPAASGEGRWLTLADADAAAALDQLHANNTDFFGAQLSLGRPPAFGGASRAGRFVEGGGTEGGQRDEFNARRTSRRDIFRYQVPAEAMTGLVLHTYGVAARAFADNPPAGVSFDFTHLPVAGVTPGQVFRLLVQTDIDTQAGVDIEPLPAMIAPPLPLPPHPHDLNAAATSSSATAIGDFTLIAALDGSGPGALKFV